MSTLQHINSAIDHFWPQYQRKFPAFQHPQIVPAETLRGMAPVYMRRNIDQDPTSYYMFVKADPTQGDCSREAFKEIIMDLFYNKLVGMASSYSNDSTTPEEAVDKEILPAAKDSEFQRYYDEQLAAVEAQQAEEEKKARADKLGFDPDDPDIIDIGDDGEVIGARQNSTDVGQAQTTAVAMPKPIWFAIDMHIQAGGMLGHNGNNRLNRRRRSSGYLNEAEIKNEEIKIHAAYEWATSKELCNDLASIAIAIDGKHIDKYDLFVFKYANGTYTWVEQNNQTKKYSVMLKNISTSMALNYSKMYKVHKLVELSVDEFASTIRESRHALKLRYDKMLAECYAKKAMFKEMLEEACK